MTRPTVFLEQADSTACQEYQSTLVQPAPRPLEEFLPPHDHPDYLATLCRLAGLEMEHRWREFRRHPEGTVPGQTIDHPPGVEHYLTRFPELRENHDAFQFLLHEEARLRKQFGDETASWSSSVGEAKPQPTERSIPGYRVLEEVGRGGMGVVYRAEQVRLKRVVALKMILAERHAGTDALARFRTEAESIARLQHPGIVQVYEVGEHDGCPFFSMELIDGGSLAKAIRGEAVPPMTAAILAEALAQAMHHAHERGVIHRDLKPANVLLAHGNVRQKLAQCEPKITDFGLAKKLDDDSGQTQTGAVMGTPSYMAPEQAAGRVHEIGPLTDVYALGAILYEMLTGRPPFKAATAVETIQQVLHRDVTPPSRLRPNLSRDLETICLKALAREPRNRYASALELAEDLARFQGGEPIRARREALAAGLWRRARRHPTLMATAAVLLIAALVVGYFVRKDTRSARAAMVATATREIESALAERDWPDDHFSALENRIDELAELDANASSELKARLPQRFAEVLRDSFSMARRPTLREEEITAIKSRIDAFAQRAPDLARGVRDDFTLRLRQLQATVLEAPFINLATAVDPALVAIEGPAFRMKAELQQLNTSIPCIGRVELQAVLGGNWKRAGRVGLVLNQSPSQQYIFELGVTDRLDAAGDSLPPLPDDTMADHDQEGHELCLLIYRNGHRLREVRIDARPVLSSSRLTLVAIREGNRLLFQVNDQDMAEYFDSFPLSSGTPGVFAIRMPPVVGIERLRLSSQVLPPRPSPLERGDELFARGQFREALDEYRRQELPAAVTDLGQELRYKIAQCLSRLQQSQDALPLFEEVAATKGARWPPLAAVHLWLLLLERQQFDQVDTVLLDLSRKYRIDGSATVLPAEIRSHLITSYSVQSLGTTFIRHDPQRVPKLERVVAINDMLRSRNYDRLHLRLSLVRAYHLAGRFADAIRLCEEMLTDPSLAGSWPDTPHRLLHWQIRVVEEYGWLMRLAGDPRKAVAAVDRRLMREAGDYREPYLPLLLERGRLHAFLKDEVQAEADLDAFLTQAKIEDLDYRYYSETHLVLGFLRHDRKDAAEAKRLWEKGTFRVWLERWRTAHPGEELPANLALAGSKFVTNMILASLAGTISKQEADDLVQQAVETALDGKSGAVFKSLLTISPELLQLLWQGPRGLDAGRKIAYRTLSWNDYQGLPTVLIGYGMLRQGAIPNATADEETLLWKLVADMQDAYFLTGTLSSAQLFGLAATWKGVTGLLGWSGVKSSVPVHLRGPLAYALAKRYRLERKDVKEARNFLQAAIDDANREPGNPLLARLARTELEQLKNDK